MNTGFVHDLLENTYWIKIRVLTPLHVGMDQTKSWLRYIDFDYESGKIYLIDKEKFLHSLDDAEIWKLALDACSKDLSGKRKRFRQEPGFDFPKACVSDEFNAINPQIRDGFGRPYLPGSSIKGAIRAILHAAKRPRLEPSGRKKFEQDYLGKIKDSPLRFVRVCDGYLPRTAIYPAKILSLHQTDNEWEAGWKNERSGSISELQPNKFMTAYEAFPAGAEGVFRLSLLPGLMEWVSNNGKLNGKNQKIVELKEISSLAALFSCINDNVRRRIQAEYGYIEKVAALLNEYDELVQPWQQLLDRLPNTQETGSRCILRLGRNVGAHSTTGNWEYPEDYYTGTLKKLNQGDNRARKTRKFALLRSEEGWQFQPFGFVELSVMQQAEEAQKLHQERLVLPETPERSRAATPLPETPEPAAEPAKPLAAEPFTGKLKDGAVIEAVALRQEGNNVVFELYLAGGNQTVSIRYPSGCEPGSIHRLEVTKVKDGKVQQARYKSAKK